MLIKTSVPRELGAPEPLLGEPPSSFECLYTFKFHSQVASSKVSALKGPAMLHSCLILWFPTPRNFLRVWAYLSLFLQHLGYSLNYNQHSKPVC